MDYRALFERLTTAHVLTPALVQLPARPAPSDVLAIAQRQVGPLDPELVEFYAQWDGADLDVIRIVKPADLRKDEFGVVFGSDPSGFVYRFNAAGEVLQEDTDGGDLEIVAKDFRDFIFGFVFGARAAEFAGEDWLDELRNAGIAT